jgi:hypothetical protein
MGGWNQPYGPGLKKTSAGCKKKREKKTRKKKTGIGWKEKEEQRRRHCCQSNVLDNVDNCFLIQE